MSEQEKTVTLTKEMFDKLISDMDKLKQAVHGPKGTGKPTESKKRTATIRFIGGKPVVGIANRGTDARPQFAYSVPDPKDSKSDILKLDVIIAGRKEPLSISHEDLRQETEAYDCEIIKKNTTPWEISHGTVERVEYKDDGYGAKGTDDYVETGPQGEYATYIIKTPQGEEFEVDEKVLNIK